MNKKIESVYFLNKLLKNFKGDKICLANHARNGYGTYVRDGFIYASLLGRAKIERELAVQSNDKTATGSSLPSISIKTLKDNSVVIPLIGGLVIARVGLHFLLLNVYHIKLQLNSLLSH